MRFYRSCVTEVPRSQLAASTEVSEAKQFNTAADSGNLYFVWPLAYNEVKSSGLKLYINNEYIGQFQENEFLNIQTSPGNYSIRIDGYMAESYGYEDWTITTFDLTVAPNSLGVIDCYGHGYSRAKPTLFITTNEQCDGGGNNKLTTDNGISYCGTLGNITYENAPHILKGLSCQLNNIKSQVLKASMVTAKVNRIENNGDSEYQQTLQQGTLIAYQSFLQSYPTSTHYSVIEKKYNELKTTQEANALTQRINKQLALDQVLPLTVF